MVGEEIRLLIRGPVSRFPRPTASLSPKGTSFSEAAASLSPGARRGPLRSPPLSTVELVEVMA